MLKAAAKKILKPLIRNRYTRDFAKRYILTGNDRNFQASYSQAGEDVVMKWIFTMFFSRPSCGLRYLDVGGNDPIFISNTYWCYESGGSGVVFEPNPVYAEKFRQVRPLDTVLEAGIAFNGAGTSEAEYYRFPDAYNGLNTFSKERADQVAARHGIAFETMKRPLMDLTDVYRKHFSDRQADLISIDVEGLELEILKTVDFSVVRPWLFCIESDQSDFGSGAVHPTVELLERNGYLLLANTSINFIFAAREHVSLQNFSWENPKQDGAVNEAESI